MSIQFLEGDCLERMKELPDKSIDCFVCDLPYGCLSNGNPKRKRFINGKDTGTFVEGQTIGGCSWDIKIDLEKFWTQVKRLAKNDNTPVIHFCNTKFGAELIASNPDWFRYDLVWNKQRGVSFLLANKMPMKSHENIYIFAKKSAYYKRIDIEGKPYSKKSKQEVCSQYDVTRVEGKNEGTRCALSVINCLNSAGHHRKGKIGNHPTQKPIELYKWLLSRYCPDGGTILDPTAGSFNSCFAGKELGLSCIGIEKDETFYTNAIT